MANLHDTPLIAINSIIPAAGAQNTNFFMTKVLLLATLCRFLKNEELPCEHIRVTLSISPDESIHLIARAWAIHRVRKN